MKKIYAFILAILLTAGAFAQVTQGTIGNGTFVGWSGSSTAYGLDFNNDGTIEFKLSGNDWGTPTLVNGVIEFNGETNSNFTTDVDAWDLAAPVANGTVISSTADMHSYGDGYMYMDYYDPPTNFALNTTQYMGFAIDLSDGIHYGYARLSITGSTTTTLTVNWEAIYYNATAGQSITVGQTPGGGTQYTITTTASPTNGGTVTGGGSYSAGTQVTLTATANTGFTFAGWADGNNNATRTITVASDATYTANFTANAPDMYTVTVLANPTNGGTVTGSGTYAAGTSVNISALPANGYRFIQWNDGNTNATRNITVTGDITYVASFQIDNQSIDDVVAMSMAIYPNPAKNFVTVILVEQYIGETISLYGIDGRIVAQQTVESVQTEFDLTSLPRGTYIVRVQGNVKKVVKQ